MSDVNASANAVGAGAEVVVGATSSSRTFSRTDMPLIFPKMSPFQSVASRGSEAANALHTLFRRGVLVLTPELSNAVSIELSLLADLLQRPTHTLQEHIDLLRRQGAVVSPDGARIYGVAHIRNEKDADAAVAANAMRTLAF